MTRLDPSASPRRNLRGAWWVAAVVVAFFVLVAVVQIGRVLRSRDREVVGDGRDPASYGFDLTSLTVPREFLAAAMNFGIKHEEVNGKGEFSNYIKQLASKL